MRGISVWIAVVCTTLISAVQAQTPPPTPPAPPAVTAPPAAAPALPPPVPFDQAILKAATDLFTKAQVPDGMAQPAELVVDPLIDGLTGIQSLATQSMGRKIVDIVKKEYPRYQVKPFTTDTIARSPVVLVGTFTPINLAGQNEGARDAFRVCLALLDLKSGKIISKGFARAQTQGVDITPVAYFNDSPVWTTDPATQAYIKSCQGTKAGDAISQAYADRVLSAALLNDAIDSYNGRRYRDAMELYQSALRTPGGDQLRAHNGVYLASLKLNKPVQAAEAFGKVVDFGLQNNRLAVKFLFRKGSSQFWSDQKTPVPYPMWIGQIAERTAKGTSCLEIVGHSSPTGPEPINLRLSALRAEFLRDRLTEKSSVLKPRVIATGVGSKENLVGTGKDDASDALDRRVEFKVIKNCT